MGWLDALAWGVSATGCVLPGAVLVASRPWSTAEKLAAASALSLAMMGAWSAATYLLELPSWANLALPALAWAAAYRRRHALAQLATDARGGLAAFALLAAALLGWVSLVHAYGGGDWWGDWLGHYERARLFADRLSPHTTLFVDDILPSRPPLANLAAASLMGAGGYATYQLSCAWIAAMAFFGVWLVAERAGGGARSPWWAAALLATSPFFVQNATYPWTKAMAATLAVCGLLFLHRALDRRDATRLAVAVGCLGASSVAHYSAVPITLAGALWIGGARLSAGRRIAALGACFAPMAVWLGWAVATFGREPALSSSTSARAWASTSGAELAGRFLANSSATLVPHALREVDRSILAQDSQLGYLRDSVFLTVQTGAPFALGAIGVPVLLSTMLRRRPSRRDVLFYGGVVALTSLVNLGAHPWASPWGVAHIGGLPLVLLGLGWLAGVASRSSAWARWLTLAAVADLTLGVALHMALQSLALDPETRAHGLGALVYDNAAIKLDRGLTFVADHLGPARVWLWPVVIGVTAGVFAKALGARVTRRRVVLGSGLLAGAAGFVFLSLEVPAVAGPEYFRWPYLPVAAGRFWALFGLGVGVPLFFAVWQRARGGASSIGWLCVAAAVAGVLPHLLRGGDLGIMVALLESETVHGYATSAASLCETTSLWAHWPDVLPDQPMHVRTHPPGLVALWCGARAVSDAPAVLMSGGLLAIASLSPWAVHRLARALDLDPDSAFWAALFAATSPTLAAFAPSFDAAYVPLACLFLWALARSGEDRRATLLAAFLAFALSQLAYTLVLLALPGAVLLAGRRAWRAALVVTLGALACHGIFSLLTGFDPVRTFQVAIENQAEHLELLSARRLPRTIGWDLADWALAGAFTLPFAALLAPRRLSALATLPPVAVALSGLSPGETFRLWSIFLPGLWLAAGSGAASLTPRARTLLVGVTLVVCGTIGRQLAFVWL